MSKIFAICGIMVVAAIYGAGYFALKKVSDEVGRQIGQLLLAPLEEPWFD